MSVSGEDNPPPASQSHFATFDNFTPNDNAPFEDEFARLASPQDWVPGSQQYNRERTIAMREELKVHFFGFLAVPQHQEGIITVELSEEDKLKGYQNLCREVHITPGNSIGECKKRLKSTLVNIVDLIDARRTNREVKVWHNFKEFRRYTLQDGHRIDLEEAKKDGGILASLLQQLAGGHRRRTGGRGKGLSHGVASGRVVKNRA